MLLRYQWLNQIKIHELGYVVGHILNLIFSVIHMSMVGLEAFRLNRLLSLALIIPPNWHLVLALICIIPP